MTNIKHCATCEGPIKDGQETDAIPYTSRGGTRGMAYRHTNDTDCADALRDWSGAGRSPSIDSPDPTGNTWPGMTGRHLRRGMSAP